MAKYPDAEIVTRDRSGSYSSAINEICPDAIQIADRFHLLMNLSDALDIYFKSISPEIRKLIKYKTDELVKATAKADLNKVELATEVQISSVIHETADFPVDQRLDTFKKVKELQLKGAPLRRISRDLGFSRNTVRSYFIQETLSPKAHANSTNFDSFTSHILTRLNIKGYLIKGIIDEIVELGFNGGRTQAYQNIHRIKAELKIGTNSFTEVRQEMIPYIRTLNSRKLAKYIGSYLPDIVDPDERKYLKTLLDNIPELQIVRKLVRMFRTMLKSGCGNIKRWIDFIKRSKHRLSGIKVFANGLSRDILVVQNSICMTCSNGTVEGHVNRIKSIKRGMYGRAGFELLRRKVILSQTG